MIKDIDAIEIQFLFTQFYHVFFFFARDFDKQTRFILWNMIFLVHFFNYYFFHTFFNVLDAWDIANLGDIISYSIVEDFYVLEKYLDSLDFRRKILGASWLWWCIWGWILDWKSIDIILFENLSTAWFGMIINNKFGVVLRSEFISLKYIKAEVSSLKAMVY